MSTKRLGTFTDFSGGINKTLASDNISQKELKEGINIDLSMRGGYSQRLGCVKAFANSVGSTKIGRMIDYPGKPLLTVGTTIKDWSNNTIFTGLATPDIGWEFFTNSKLYFVDGVEYRVYDGATTVAVTPASGADLVPIKRCTVLVQRGQRMFALGDPQNPNFIYFSEPGDPTNFRPGNAIKAVTNNTDTLLAAVMFHQSVVAFKKRNVFVWTGWDPATDVRFDQLDVHDGTLAPMSICKAENYLLYLGEDAVIALVGLEANTIVTMRTSPGITDLIKSLTNRDKAVGTYYQGCYYLACCDNGTGINNLILKGYVNMMYSAEEDQTGIQKVMPWTVYRGWSVSQWFRGSDNRLYFSSPSTGYVYKAFETNDDDGVAVSSQVTHRLSLDDSFRQKKIKQLLLLARQFEGKSCVIDLQISFGYKKFTKVIDLNESAFWDVSEWDEVLWDFDDIVMKEILLGEKCQRVEVTITHSNLDEPLSIYGFASVYKSKKAKGVRTGVTDRP